MVQKSLFIRVAPHPDPFPGPGRFILRPGIRFPRIALGWIGALFLAACAAGTNGTVKDLPPLIPLSEDLPAAQAGMAGQQSASLSLTRRGRDSLEQGRTDEAITLLEKAIALQPTNPYAYYYMARARFIQSESGQALALLAKAELSFGDDSSWLTWVFLLRGQIDETLSRPEDARKQYEAALAADPRNQEARDRIRRLDEFPDR